MPVSQQALTECEAFLTARLSSDSDFDWHLQVTSTKSVALLLQVLKCATFDLAIQAFYLDFWSVDPGSGV